MPNLADAAAVLAEMIHGDLTKCLLGMDLLNTPVAAAHLAMVITAFRDECNLQPESRIRQLRADLDLSIYDDNIELLVREWRNFP